MCKPFNLPLCWLLDELAGFEQAWKGNSEKHFPAWDDGSTFNDAAGKHGGCGCFSS